MVKQVDTEIVELQNYVGKYFVHLVYNAFGRIRDINKKNGRLLLCNAIYFWDDCISIEKSEDFFIDEIKIISKEEYDERFSKAVKIIGDVIEFNYDYTIE